MFDHLTNAQGIADQLKRWADDAPARSRQQLLDLVQKFEGAPWHPQALEEAAQGIALKVEAGQLTWNGGEADRPAAVEQLLKCYFTLTTAQLTPRLYSTKEAADYLGLTVPALKYHIYEAGDLEGIKVGNSIAFTEALLDEFNARRRSPGRPRKAIERE